MATKNRFDEESTAQEAPDLESSASEASKHGFFVRLYTGTGAFEFERTASRLREMQGAGWGRAS